MRLLQDANGIPIAYRKFSGNTPDCATMVPVLANPKRNYGFKRAVTVADKGLNCSESIAATVASDNGFVFSQSVRAIKSDEALKRWVLDSAGYKHKDGNFDYYSAFATPFHVTLLQHSKLR